MREVEAGDKHPGSLLILLILLTATGGSAQPLLRHVDTFQGFPSGGVFDLAFTGDGEFLYVAGRSGFSVLRRADDGESFRFLASYPAGSPHLAPDDAHVYAVGGPALTVFYRDTQTGLLTPVQTLVAGEMGLPDFTAISDAVFSPLGDFLYLGQSFPDDHKLLVFERAGTTGWLSFVQELTPPEPDTSLRLRSLLMSPAGENLYVLGDPAVTTYDRDPGSGRLTLADALDRLADDAIDIVRTWAGAVSPDGENLYVMGQNTCYNSCRLVSCAENNLTT